MLRATLLFLCGIIFNNLSIAQQVIATDGNYAATSQGSLSWTLGEVVTETISNSNGFLTQGFQQNYEDILEIENMLLENDFSVYPNPFSSDITLNLAVEHPDYKIFVHDYQYKLFFENALIFQTGVQQLTIDLSELSDGFYFLTIQSSEDDIQFVARIIKTNN